ncbi:HLA class II histocompatibility antigen, DM alpha chain [Sceloporus undulatus]|uniref:HLA class II histocompatibility antigen, DM alpha chain n=1 Tax=Sceloporus undulatus TaxID=8520 RepID=UPI001C4B75A3|nr:HLA class II histocompatibility antigen, DM alpha chain [Sceloporus undulatus]
MGPRRCLGGLLGGLLFFWGATGGGGRAAAAQEAPSHLFSEVFSCQPDSPFLGLAQTLDDEPLFWFDFPRSTWQPRLPDFQPEERNRTPQVRILKLAQVCKAALDNLTEVSEAGAHMPEAKGSPQLEVFTLQPLELGRPNTLVCAVSNLFPPSVKLSWQLDGEPLPDEGPGPQGLQIYPVLGLGFQAFSYLEVTPQQGQVYSCIAMTPRDTATSVAFWVPKDPIDPELLANVLCGLAFGLGILFTIVGAVLLFLTFRLRETE